MFHSFATPWSVVHHAPLSLGFSRQEYRGGLPYPSPGNLSDPGIEPASPALAVGFFNTLGSRKNKLAEEQLIKRHEKPR